jgi:hypothetical protein
MEHAREKGNFIGFVLAPVAGAENYDRKITPSHTSPQNHTVTHISHSAKKFANENTRF